MATAQQLIDSLRQGEYYTAMRWLDFINVRYKECGQIPADKYIPLMIYELLMTDVSVKDIATVRFIYSFAKDNGYISLEYESINLIIALSFVFAIKNHVYQIEKDGALHTAFQILLLSPANDRQQVEDLLAPESLFSQLQEKAGEHQPTYSEQMNAPLSAQQCRQYIKEMDKACHEALLSDFQTTSWHMDNVKNSINEYFSYLNNRVLQKKIKYEKGAAIDISLPENKQRSDKTVKLMNRYNAVLNLKNSLKDEDIADENVNRMISDTLGVCRLNEPEWFENRFIDKIISSITSTFKLSNLKGFFYKDVQYVKHVTQVSAIPAV